MITICTGGVSSQVKESHYLPPRLDQRYGPPSFLRIKIREEGTSEYGKKGVIQRL